MPDRRSIYVDPMTDEQVRQMDNRTLNTTIQTVNRLRNPLIQELKRREQ